MVRTVQFRQQKVGSYTYWFSTCNTLLMICHKVFVIRCLYSAVSLTLVREQRFIRIIYYYAYVSKGRLAVGPTVGTPVSRVAHRT